MILSIGPVVRIGPNHVLISDPADIRKVLAVGSSYTRGPWFDALKLHHDETNIVSEREPKRHQLKRNILSVGVRPFQAHLCTFLKIKALLTKVHPALGEEFAEP